MTTSRLQFAKFAAAWFLSLVALLPAASAQSCFQIRGRAVSYRGDAFFEIWHVGTHHTFFPADKASEDLICRYFDCESPDRQPALFADFTICPAEPYTKGASQRAIVKSIQHPRVVPEWPPLPAREFVEEFYTWYSPRSRPGDTAKGWKQTLELMRFDLSDELARLLAENSASHGTCAQVLSPKLDPFLNAEEPDQEYKVTNVRLEGNTYKAEVSRIENGAPLANPAVVAEFRKKDEHWVFVNFLYPSGSDLVTTLKSETHCHTR